MNARIASSLLLSLCLAGCVLPAAAPTARQIESAADHDGPLQFAVVELTPAVAKAMAADLAPDLSQTFGNVSGTPQVMLQPGDVISVTIFESGSPGLFAAAPASTSAGAATGTTLAAQVVEADGTITIPFAGRVKVAGKTPSGAGAAIAHKLAGKAVQPQVIVSPANGAGNVVFVGGEVNKPGPIVLTPLKVTILDALAQAGGSKYSFFDTRVRLIRGGVSGEASLQALLDRPLQNDIAITSGDEIFVTKDPLTFDVVGAALKVNHFDFDVQHVTLAEAISKSGGLVDAISDLSGVYLLRYEPRAVADEVLKAAPSASIVGSESVDGLMPVAYRLDLQSAEGYLLAQQIHVHDKDLIVATNAEGTQIAKFFGLLRGPTGVYYDLSWKGPR